MIFTHFSLSFLIKNDMFFPEFVVCKLYDILCYFYFISFYFIFDPQKHIHVAPHNIIWVLR